MIKPCPRLNDYSCSFWINYQVSLESLKDAEELSHANWIEICSLQHRVNQLEAFILELGLDPPEKEY